MAYANPVAGASIRVAASRHRNSRARFTLLAAILLVTCLPCAVAGQNLGLVDSVIVYKQERKLVLMSQGQVLKSYKVALGKDPLGPKSRYGDHRTPEGSYILDARNPHSQYYKAYHISYPSKQDLANARRRGVRPGGDIMLHGLPKEYAWVGKAHSLQDWTEGCIAVSNEEMDEIWELVPVGTPIHIRP